jgi:uncharacterized protein (DUF2147 family)
MKTTIVSLFLLIHLAYNSRIMPSISNNLILGDWYSDTKDGKIEIFKRGEKYYGKVVWLRDDKTTDWQNPNPKLRSQKVLGMVILKDFTFKDNKWEGGTIYDPNNGKSYSCVLKIDEKNNLVVRGYIGISLIGRSSIWTRNNKS